MNRIAFFALCLGTFVALVAANVLVNGPRIERELEARTFYAAKDDFSVDEVRFDGRDGVVFAMVRDAKERAELEKRANGVWGVRVARVETRTDRAPEMLVERTAEGTNVAGRVPAGAKDEILGALAAALGKAPGGDLEENAKISRRGYLASFKPYFQLLAEGGSDARLELRDDTLSLRLTADGETTQDRFAARAREALPRGLRLVLELRNAARATAAAPATLADDTFRRALEKLNPLFVFAQPRVLPQSEQDVREAAALLKAHPERKVRVLGYTDALGSDTYNLKLGDRRAAAVVAALVAAGVKADQLVAEPRGKTDFVASNATQTGRQANRRVQFVVVNEGGR